MDKIRTLLVDDERPARRALRGLLEKRADIEIVGEAMDGERALELIRELRPALVLLDVQMPMMTGLEVVERLPRTVRTEIIFVTAYDQHALKAFELAAMDYIVKPFSDARFHAALDRAVRRIRSGEEGATGQALRAVLAELQKKDAAPGDFARLVVKADGQLHFINQRHIRWVEGQGDFVKLHLVKGSLFTRTTMSKLAGQLDPALFQRIHKSTIVNLSYVRLIKPMLARSHGMELDDGTSLPIGASYGALLGRLK
jgi:two-component system LytT family response regulator